MRRSIWMLGPALLAGCVSSSHASSGVTAPRPPVAGSCHSRGSPTYVLPDTRCTPGAINPGVTQADIGRTICRSGWTSTVRPPESYTETLKYRQMTAYGDTGPASAYEEDHLIPLELGGSPASPLNLWPQPGSSPNPKDDVESAARRAVCDGAISLASAQHAMAVDWVAFGRQLGWPASPSGPAAAAKCTATASYSTRYGDYDIYVHSNQPDQPVHATAGSSAASWHTDRSGYADVFVHAPRSPGQPVAVTAGAASCSTKLT